MDAPQPLRLPVTARPAAAHPAKAKADARPMRLALGAGGLAALSALAAAIVLPPRPATTAPLAQVPRPTNEPVTAAPTGTPVQLQRPIRYVQLKPGESAPPGATVIPATAPTPITMIVTVPAPAAPKQAGAPAPPPAANPPAPVTTTQSGKVVP
jgi:hypothetical protein